jgi:hypothetical protein
MSEDGMSSLDLNELQGWKDAVNAVVTAAQTWAKQRGWRTEIAPIQLTEDRLGTYEVPLLTVETPQGKMVLEPIARWTSPGDGRIDVLGWPSLNRLTLVRQGNDWVLETEGGMRWPQPWNPATFADLAGNLNRAA